ncbi:RNA-directed DNA polymerase [Vibrio alginolyticus]|nr:RNA-directed DNA polymerase [Vibrio alginolyticus]
MKIWRPQLYHKLGIQNNLASQTLNSAIEVGNQIKKTKLDIPIIFSINHLAKLSGVNTAQLLRFTCRSQEDRYTVFPIRKRTSKRKRYICVPPEPLLRVQKYINQEILHKIPVHHASMAFAKNNCIVDVAAMHCGSKWLIKLDVRDFFENISEVAVYKVFRGLGYPALLSFQLSRLCTRIVPYQHIHGMNNDKSRWKSPKSYSIKPFNSKVIGSLPQGAPTSPMLSNLVCRTLDEAILSIAQDYGLYYTRYADDIALSTADSCFTRSKCQQIIRKVNQVIWNHSLSPNRSKVKVIPPGGRKTILGLLVNGTTPKLQKEFKSNLLNHLYYCNHKNIGPVLHAKHKGFDSVIGFKRHISGLVNYACQVESDFGERVKREFNTIVWPID